MQPIKFEEEIDIQDILDSIQNAKSLTDNNELFRQLAKVQFAKDKLELIQDKIKEIEYEVKSVINSKAKALYGEQWNVVKGKGYKISRNKTGAVYEVVGTVDKKYLSVKVNVDSKAVNDFIKETSELPEGIGYNAQRNESIRITVNEI